LSSLYKLYKQPKTSIRYKVSTFLVSQLILPTCLIALMNRSSYITHFTIERISLIYIYSSDKESENLPLPLVRRYLCALENPVLGLSKCTVLVWICCKVRATLESSLKVYLTIIKC
jgi:membrane-associated HD superfamily phosphohydrolase